MMKLQSRGLDIAFFASLIAVVGLVGVAIAQEVRRPILKDQRIVPALGVVDRCEHCHDAASHRGEWATTHPVERFGCTTCHGGQGLATNADDAHKAHLDWERPLFGPLEREANCGTCHSGDLAAAPTLTAGRHALADRGCAGCHEIPGLDAPNIAPELDGLRDKVKPAWVRAWLTDPAKLDVGHRMPRFDLVPAQIEALTAFLFSLPGREIGALPAELHGDPDRGKVAVATRRCATCHLIDGRGGTLGPGLGAAGAKIEGNWLFAYLADTHRVHPRTRMPGFKLPDAEAADIVAYATEEWVPDTAELPWSRYEAPVRADLAPEGKQLFSDLGCRGCHYVESVAFVRAAMPLTSIADRHLTDLLATKNGDHYDDIPSWVSRKLAEPHAFDFPGAVPARMPAYRMDVDETRALGVAVAALRTTRARGTYLKGAATSNPVPVGAVGRLVERFRCLVCHSIGGQGGDVSRVPLDGEGSRAKRAWIERFLQSPTTLRMDQSERMPLLGIDEPSAVRLASWIQASLTDPRIAVDEPPFSAEEATLGKQLFVQHGCPSCHVAEGQGTMKGPVLDGAGDRLEPAYAVAMLQQGNVVVPHGRHPDQVFARDQARAMGAYVCGLAAPKFPEPSPDAGRR